MTSTINPIKELIEERIDNLLGKEQEDLSYVDLFFPKLITLIGTNGCIKIYDGQDPKEVFQNVGLEKEDYESIASLIGEGKRIYFEDSSLETLYELDKRSDVIIKGYLNKVRNFKIKSGASLKEINKFDDDVRNFFDNGNEIFTPISDYEKEFDNKNNVK